MKLSKSFIGLVTVSIRFFPLVTFVRKTTNIIYSFLFIALILFFINSILIERSSRYKNKIEKAKKEGITPQQVVD